MKKASDFAAFAGVFVLSWQASPVLSQGILDELRTTMSCAVHGPAGTVNLRVGKNDDASLTLFYDGMKFPEPITEGDKIFQYEKSDDGNTYAIKIDQDTGMYYIFDFETKTARIFGLNGMMDATGMCK